MAPGEESLVSGYRTPLPNLCQILFLLQRFPILSYGLPESRTAQVRFYLRNSDWEYLLCSNAFLASIAKI